MASYRYSRSVKSSETLTFLGAMFLIGLVFVAIVLWPSTPRITPPAVLGETPLSRQLNDAETVKYLNVLNRVKPELSSELHAQAEAAIADGASNDELALLVVGSYGMAVQSDFKTLMQADVTHMEKLISLTQNGLRTLSMHAPKYCQLATLEPLERKAPEQIVEELGAAFNYESRGYSWVLRFNTATLEAVENGREARNKYGRLTAADEQAMQALIMRLMTGPQASKLMRLQSLSGPDQQRAMMTMNMCDISIEGLVALNELPRDTKGRLMGELRREFGSGLLDPGMLGRLGIG